MVLPVHGGCGRKTAAAASHPPQPAHPWRGEAKRADARVWRLRA